MRDIPQIVNLIVSSLCIIAILIYIQFSYPYLVGYDGFFHIKFASLLKNEGFIDKLPWLYFTIHRDFFRDHHLLFHYILIPFTHWELNLGGKLAAVVLSSISVITLWFILRELNVRFAFMWTIITFFLLSSDFIYRFSMLRVQIIFIAILVFSFFLLIKRKKYGLVILSAISVYLYDGFILLPFFCFIFLNR